MDGQTPCSRLEKDETNTEFKHWYIFKIGKETIKLPMAYNKLFHDEDFDLTASHTVKLNDKGRVNVGLLHQTKRPYEITKTINSNEVVGIDLNVASNFCALAFHDHDTLIDYDRTYVQKVVEKLQSLEEKGYKLHTIEEDKTLKKLLGGVEFYFKKLISEILNNLRI
jgi:hypothetical protein